MNCNTTHYRANSSSVPGDPTDHDLLTNLLEYLTGGEPLIAGEIGPTVSRSGSELMLTYSRALAATDVLPVVEWGTDLLGWSESGVTEEIVSDNGTIQTCRARVDTGSASGAFIRLRATAVAGAIPGGTLP